MFAGALAICWRGPLLPRNREMRRICIQLCPEVKTTTGYVTVHPGFNAVCLNHWSLRSAAAKTSLDWRKRNFFSAERRVQWFRQTALKPLCIVTHRGVVSTSQESYVRHHRLHPFLYFLAAMALSSILQTLQRTVTSSTQV